MPDVPGGGDTLPHKIRTDALELGDFGFDLIEKLIVEIVGLMLGLSFMKMKRKGPLNHGSTMKIGKRLPSQSCPTQGDR
jgi:hypothetical protein